MRRLRCILHGNESGQTIIFFAILTSALLGIVGLTVEGGRVFVEYRHLQSAADMAAIVGAQKLPCGTSDTACITAAENQACTYATANGFSGCSAGGGSAPTANVPPLSCSPYDFLDYGNGSSNSSCKSANAPGFYDYIETQLSDNLGTVPIFKIPVTLTAHAVARHGIPSPGDYALIELDPNNPLDMSGSGVVGLVGSAFGQGGIVGNKKSNIACDGGWFTDTSTDTNVITDNTGKPTFAPAACTGSVDGSPLVATGLPALNDPFANSSAPPTVVSANPEVDSAASFPNCSVCKSPGWWYGLDTSNAGWHQGGSISGGDVELFPGIYNSISLGNGDSAYFNPGIYTFTGGLDTNHGDMCIYGAPDCDNLACATPDFSAGTATSDQWNYTCSPYGYWDSSSFGGTRPDSLPTTGPTFYDASSGTASSTPLNGMTAYIVPNATGVTTHGNSGKNGGVYLAASDPCPGTGTYSAGPPGTVSFPSGSTSGVFSYPGTNTWGLPHDVTQSSAGVVYPSIDFSLLGECNNQLLDWPGEFAKPQHLHFLWYAASTQIITLNGASAQQWTGIVYGPQTTWNINGAGKGANGPPWVDGQVIGWDINFGGNSYEDIAYRPCGSHSDPCSSGGGTELVQ